jgi:hypothetical protein
MFKVKVTEHIITHCKNQIKKYAFGQRGIADGTPEQQLTGIIGQSAVMNIFYQGLIDGSTGFDYGEDLVVNNKKIDVKTMGRKTNVRPYYTNYFLALQDKFNTYIYVFCSLNKTNQELTVCGWITKKEFKNKRNFFKKGSIRTRSDGSTFKTFADLFEIDMKVLKTTENEDDLIQQINLATRV